MEITFEKKVHNFCAASETSKMSELKAYEFDKELFTIILFFFVENYYYFLVEF